MPQQPAVTLTEEEHMTLESFVHRARILLKSAEGWSISDLAGVGGGNGTQPTTAWDCLAVHAGVMLAVSWSGSIP